MTDEDTKPDTLKAILEAANRAANEAIKCNLALHELRNELESRFRSIELRLSVLEGRSLTPDPQ